MPGAKLKSLAWKFFTLVILAAALFAVENMAPTEVFSRDEGSCDIYQLGWYCYQRGREADETACDCVYTSCLQPLAVDCQEVGLTLDVSTCTCAPTYRIPWCDPDLYQECFERATGVNAMNCTCYDSYVTGGGSRLCSTSGRGDCLTLGGAWDDWNCTCNFTTTTNTCSATQSTINACETQGGVWVPASCFCRL